MTTWYAQQSSQNINAANMWNDVANGTGNWLTWPPASGDILCANGKTAIEINVDVNLGSSGKLTTRPESGTTGGYFQKTVSPDVIITANIEAGGNTCLSCSYSTLTINGNIYGSNATSSKYGVVFNPTTATNSLNVNGNIYAGTVVGTHGLVVSAANTVTVNIQGQEIRGGSFYNSNGLQMSSSGATVNITSNIYSGSSAGAYGCAIANTNNVITIHGNIEAISANALYTSSTGNIFNIYGDIIGSSSVLYSALYSTQPATTTINLTGNLINKVSPACMAGWVNWTPGNQYYIKQYISSESYIICPQQLSADKVLKGQVHGDITGTLAKGKGASYA